jgi:gas vesicle protein GvpL/GvpF
MAAPASRGEARGSQQTGWYVYGIVPGDVEVVADVRGVGDPPGRVQLVRDGGLVALVSEIGLDRPLGTPEDLRAHQQVLDATAAQVPVLPLRFGAVMTSTQAVTEELLAAHHERFAAALHELEGRAEYLVKGRYVEAAVLAEVLSENKQAARLRDRIRGKDPDATRHELIQLGHIINIAVTAKRQADTRVAGDALQGLVVASAVREPTHELDAVHIAFLAEIDREDGITHAVNDLARNWEGRIDLRLLLGPMAPYDFVATLAPLSDSRSQAAAARLAAARASLGARHDAGHARRHRHAIDALPKERSLGGRRRHLRSPLPRSGARKRVRPRRAAGRCGTGRGTSLACNG